jgi:hypothetical protein
MADAPLTTSGLDLDKIKQAVSTTAQKTSQVTGPQQLSIPAQEPIGSSRWTRYNNRGVAQESVIQEDMPSSYGGWRRSPLSAQEVATQASKQSAAIRTSAAKQSFESQKEAVTQQAAKSAEALNIMGEATTKYLTQLEEVKEQANAAVTSSKDAWARAEAKADEYVQSSRARVGEVLTKLDEINSQIGDRRDFAKAHDMQVAVQSTLGQMNSEGRAIGERYGIDSAEYQQFQQSKRATLGTIQSNIHANYQKIRESQDISYMNATNEAMWKHNMYTSYQEQQHVETLRYMAQAEDQYNLQLSNFNTTIEQLKMSGLENLANWMVSTPVYSVDVLPLMNYIADSYVSV